MAQTARIVVNIIYVFYSQQNNIVLSANKIYG